MPKPIIIDQFNKGGLADSKWSGVKHSLHEIVGMDLHSKPGIIEARQALAKTSSTTVTGLIKNRVACSDGNSYWFDGDSGKIWKCTTGGTVSLAHTTTPDEGEAKCLGAAEYYGYIYWATEKRLHRIPVNTTALADWSTYAEEDWQQLNLDQSLATSGNAYTNTTAVNEGATHKQSFVPDKSPCEAVALEIGGKGTGNWTLKVHDSSDVEVGTATVTNGNMSASGYHIFTLAASFNPVLGDTYHIHIYSSVADGTTVTTTAADFETASFRTYTNGDSEFKPMMEQNLILFIGDQNFVHQVENAPIAGTNYHTFTKDALDLSAPFRIKTLGKYMKDLLIGTYVSDNVNKTTLFRWNTWSPSFTGSDEIEENGINAFLQSDNFTFINAGKNGNIYVYNGETLELYRPVPGDYSPTAEAWVHPNAVGNLGGLMLFGMSNSTGNPCSQGVYMIGRFDRKYNFVMDLSFPISERSGGAFVTSGIEIGAILVMGSDVFVSWKNSSTYGIDKLDYSTKLNGAYIATRVETMDREKLNTIKKVVVPYASLPSDTDIDIGHKINYPTPDTYTAMDNKDDEDRNVIYSEEGQEASTFQLQFTFTTNSNDSPQMESAAIFTE